MKLLYLLVLVNVGRGVQCELFLPHSRSRRFLNVFMVLALTTLSGSSIVPVAYKAESESVCNLHNQHCHGFCKLRTHLQIILNKFWHFLANVNSRYMLSPVRLSVVCLSVTFVHPTQPVESFGNVYTPFGTLTIR